ncbi:MAG TPA: hypothetical protein VFT75_12680 [Nocardioidaceae bacterium]|jgi:Mce-associated membrane protein|nr:hypothetical protein [Nocardioidaceae bacterium]
MPKPSPVKTGRRRIAGERSTRRPESRAPQPEAEEPSSTVDPEHSAVVDPELSSTGEPEVTPAAGAADQTRRPRPSGTGPSNLVLAILAVLAAATVAGAAFFAVPAWRDHGVQQAQQNAPSVAERAAKAILSYDYTSLDHDEKAAASYMTPTYRKKYEHTFRLVKDSAPHLKAKVTSRVLGSGVSEADGEHAHVLVFVDQTTKSTANGGQPQVALNRVMFTMVLQDGRWLVNGITSY